MTVGLYAPNNELLDKVKACVGRDVVVVPPSTSDMQGQEGSPPTHLINKQLLLERSTHVIVQITDVESLSMLTGALRRLLDGKLTAVMAIGSVPLEFLYATARHDGTEVALRNHVQNKRFVIVENLDSEQLKRFLRSN